MEIYGSATTININRASSSFTHTITYSFSGLTGTIATKTSSTSIGWTIPTSFYKKIPDAKSGVVTINCQTFNGNTSIGTSSTTANVFVINSEPTVDATIKDVNATTVALTGNSDKMVKYFSNAEVHVTATAKNSAKIRGRRITCGNKTSILPTDILYNIESGTFVATCNDTRGFSATKTITKELVEYIKLAITDISLERPTTTSNTVNASIRGNYFNQNFGASNNTLTIRFRYKQSGGEWSSYTTLTPTISGNTFSLSTTLGSVYDFNKEYEFEINIIDKLMNVTQSVTVTRGIPIIDIGEDDVIVNGDVTVNKSWQEIILTNEWENYGAGYQSAQYKKIGNQIFLRGLIRNGSNNTIAFTLPSGYRPPADLKFTTNTNNEGGTAVVTINASGTVTINHYTGWVALEQISFFID